ncbi:hypothetical protein RJ641_008604, partial [Dillenia turbinata]
YPTDPYDRYWYIFNSNGLRSVPNGASSVDVNQTEDKVPSAVMSNALATLSTSLEGLASLQEGFPELKEWSGDPCIPAEYPWDWVNCTNEATPRITSL